MQSIFVTGGSGFVGRALLPMLAQLPLRKLLLLGHRSPISVPSAPAGTVTGVLQGSLNSPRSFAGDLEGVDCVIHLSAATGKATRAEHFRINVEGTRNLVEACRAAGVRRFLYVSSIAAKFANKTRYWYAQAKQQAEEIVRASGMAHCIARPTMIFGRHSPVQSGLERLALLPVVPVFGDGKTPVQPIAVDDVAGFLLAILEQELFHGATLELGGPATISIEDLLRRMRRARGGGDARVMHFPLGLVVPPLTVMEWIAYRALPVTVGQLAAFRNAGTIMPHPLWESRRGRLKTLEEMLGARG